jgi:hypothetical protein
LPFPRHQFVDQEFGVALLVEYTEFFLLLLELQPGSVVVLKEEEPWSQLAHNFAAHELEEPAQEIPSHRFTNIIDVSAIQMDSPLGLDPASHYAYII